MRKLNGPRNFLFFAGLFCACFQLSSNAAEEEVSTTTTNSVSTAPATTTTSAPATAPESSATVAPAPVTSSTNQPLGAGTFSPPPIEIQLTVIGGYDDNINTAVNGHTSGSELTSGQVDLDYEFGNPRLQLKLVGSGGGTYYYQHIANQNYDVDLHTNFVAKYKATPRLTLGGDFLVAYLTEPSFNYGVGTNYRNGNYFYTFDKLDATYQWTERFSTLTRYTLDFINYDDSTIGVFDDRVENVFGNEFRFLLVPTTTFVAEYRYGIVNYIHLSIDSDTHYVLAGFDHTFNPRLTATVRGGAEFRSYNTGGERSSPYFESNVAYAVGRRTSVTWTTRYGLEEPDIPGAQSRTTFRTGLQGKIKVAPRVTASADVYYDHSDYNGFSLGGGTVLPFTQNTIDAGVGLRYTVTPYMGITAGYRYTDVSSDFSSFQYSRNHYFAGLNVVF